jgi:hypothetical protein
MAKSTHKGHCQACGRLQMLPSGKLAQHGYTVAHGFFSGVCVGSKELPFEVSCDLVKLFIQNAKARLADVEKFQASLRQSVPEGTKTAWFHTRHASRKGYGYSATYAWQECTVTETVVPYRDGDGSYKKFTRTGDEKRVDVRNAKGYMEMQLTEEITEVSAPYQATVEEVCEKANRVYADWLEHEADSLRRYIAWQTERVASWKPAPLFPLAQKDKLGFVPTAPRY